MKTRPSHFVLVMAAVVAIGSPRSLQGANWYEDGATVPTTTELTISPAIPVQAIGSPVTLTSKTSGVQKAGVTVSFYVDGTLIGTALTDASSQASFPFDTLLLAEGQHTFRADFPDTVTATTLLGRHVRIYINDVFVGYYDLYVRDWATASSGQLIQQFRDTRPPLVFSQPTNHIVATGSDVNLGADIRGQSPLSRQWYVGEEPLTGATDATLTLTGVQANQAGMYTVMASNSLGTITSSPAALTVFTVSTSLSPPDNASVDEGSAVTFGVDAFGALPLTFQWRHNGTNLPSATAASLSLANVQPTDAGVYSVEIGDGVVSVSAPVATFAVQPKGVSIASSIWLADRGFQLAFEGSAWFNQHVIAVSTNLVDWSVLTNVSSVGGILSVVDSEAAGYPQRFYRVESSFVVQPIPNMVWINPGTFTMGSPTTEVGRSSDEGPQTQVTLTRGFWMGIYEVTQAEYQAIISSNPSYFTGDPNRPVEQVSWNVATNYCATLTQREHTAGRLPDGFVYRLPTEAEWEYAARAGSTTRFSYGDDPFEEGLANYAWYSSNSGSQTHPVGQKLPNPWGLYDMHGNVFEWCQDWWGYYPGGSVTDPQGPASGSYRVDRGGGWSDAGQSCRSANRGSYDPGSGAIDLGFRVALVQSP